MAKIAIIGANGQLGSDICSNLKKNNETIPLFHSDIEVAKLNSVEKCLDYFRPEIVINTAAYHDLNNCEKNPELSYSINAIGPRNIAIWCKKNNALIIHISTDYVFNGDKNSPYTEEDCTFPLNQYGITKLAGEYCISSILDKYVIIRSGGLYGTHSCRGKSAKNFIEMFIDLIKEKDVIEFGGDEINTPTFTENLANQIETIIDSNVTGLFHATCEGFCSWFEFGEEIIKQTGAKTRLIKRRSGIHPIIEVIKRPKYSVLENMKLKRIGLNMMPHWKDALQEYLNKRLIN